MEEVGGRQGRREMQPVAAGGEQDITTIKGTAAGNDQAAPSSLLLILPNEIRNEILGLVLIHDDPISINYADARGCTAGWPGVLDTCKQLRDGALPVYLGNNDFVFRFVWPRFEGLSPWLAKLKEVPFAMMRLIKSVTIDFDCSMLEEKRNLTRGFSTTWYERTYEPRFDFCDEILARISDAGLMAHQLVWPGVSAHTLRNGGNGRSHGGCQQRFLLNEFILTPLLHEHGLFDERRPPVNVYRQVGDHWQNIVCASTAIDVLGDVTYWEGHPPSQWFDAWVAKKTELLEGEETHDCEGED